MQNCFLTCFNSVFFHKSGHKCFDRSGPFLKIRSLIYTKYSFKILNNTALRACMNNPMKPILFGLAFSFPKRLRHSNFFNENSC